MLKKIHRLNKSKDIKQTSMRGRGFFNPNFVLKYSASSVELPRFTIIASTKVSKKAVVRNKLKRVLREAIRTRLPKFKPGDYVVIIKAKAAAEPRELPLQFIKLVRTVKLLND